MFNQACYNFHRLIKKKKMLFLPLGVQICETLKGRTQIKNFITWSKKTEKYVTKERHKGLKIDKNFNDFGF